VYARWRQAEALLETRGPRAQATRLLEGAYRVAARLGARPLCDEMHHLAGRVRLTLTAEGPDADPVAEPVPFGLTRRELDVLGLMATGRTNRQIAKALFISEHTVSIHVSRVLAKLGVNNRVAAAARAHQIGIV
jgi:DNA-binding CsgD family transcriptional regulator